MSLAYYFLRLSAGVIGGVLLAGKSMQDWVKHDTD